MKHCNVESFLQKSNIYYTIEGDRDFDVGGISSLEEATENDLSFCSSRVYDDAAIRISKSNAAIILCHLDLCGHLHTKDSQALIFVDNPRLAFIKIVNYCMQQEKETARPPEGISPHAVISTTARIGSNVTVGDLAVIGDNCTVGDDTVIYDRVSLVRNCKIGNNCTIQSGVTIGFDGFAYERLPNGNLEGFPHFAGVIIGNNVDICSGSQIARGSLTDTLIDDGTKLDALVYVAHNVKIGKNCQLAGGTIVGGSAKIGDECWTGIHSSIKQKIHIGRNVIVGAGATVLRDVPDGDIVAGVPAKSIKDKVTAKNVFMMAGQQSR
jgi:UDP-3-O-[3-hydroxymyristoyl] glucosamine N-acyltransferase